MILLAPYTTPTITRAIRVIIVTIVEGATSPFFSLVSIEGKVVFSNEDVGFLMLSLELVFVLFASKLFPGGEFLV